MHQMLSEKFDTLFFKSLISELLYISQNKQTNKQKNSFKGQSCLNLGFFIRSHTKIYIKVGEILYFRMGL